MYQGGTAFELIRTKPNEIIIGSDEGIAKSTDYGSSWINASFDEKPALIDDISFDQNNPDIGYVTGSGNLYKTIYGGLTWLKVEQLEEIYPVDVNPYNSNIIFAQKAGDSGWRPHSLSRSTDAGVTWAESDIDRFITDIHFSATNDSLVFGMYAFDMLKSTNLGKSWESIKRPANQGLNFSALSVEKEVLCISELGFLFESKDNGNNWDRVWTKELLMVILYPGDITGPV